MRIPFASVSTLTPQPEIVSSLEEMIYSTTSGALKSADVEIGDIDGVCMASSDLNDGRAISTMTLTGSTGSFHKSELRVCNDSLAAFWVAAAEIGSGAAARLIVCSWNKGSDVVDPHSIPALALEPAFHRPLGYHPDVVTALRRSHETGEITVVSESLPPLYDVAVGFVLGAVPNGHRLADLVGTGSSMSHYVDVRSTVLGSTSQAATAALASAGIAIGDVRRVYVAGMHIVSAEELADELDVSIDMIYRQDPAGADLGYAAGAHVVASALADSWSGHVLVLSASGVGLGNAHALVLEK